MNAWPGSISYFQTVLSTSEDGSSRGNITMVNIAYVFLHPSEGGVFLQPPSEGDVLL